MDEPTVEEWCRLRSYLLDLSRNGIDTIIIDGRRWTLRTAALDGDGEPLYRLGWLREFDEA